MKRSRFGWRLFLCMVLLEQSSLGCWSELQLTALLGFVPTEVSSKGFCRDLRSAWPSQQVVCDNCFYTLLKPCQRAFPIHSVKMKSQKLFMRGFNQRHENMQGVGRFLGPWEHHGVSLILLSMDNCTVAVSIRVHHHNCLWSQWSVKGTFAEWFCSSWGKTDRSPLDLPTSPLTLQGAPGWQTQL